jgi:hypothetical protein
MPSHQPALLRRPARLSVRLRDRFEVASEIGTFIFAANVCASIGDRRQSIIGVGFRHRRLIVRYGILIFAAAALSSSQVSAGELQSVYVAPGGVYIANARVYVAPGPGSGEPPYVAPGSAYGAPGYGTPGYGAPAPTYGPPGYVAPGPAYGAPGYGAPGPAYRAPAFYGAAAHAAPPVYVEREQPYPSAYAAEYVPRPPAAIPYNGGGRCTVNLGYGRWGYCN